MVKATMVEMTLVPIAQLENIPKMEATVKLVLIHRLLHYQDKPNVPMLLLPNA
jgi:hypothetical protein